MIKKIIFLLTLPALLAFGQNTKPIEKKSSSNFTRALSGEAYKSDTTLDAGFYKLDLAIDSSGQNIKGNVTLKFKSLISGKESFFLDLADVLNVDSVTSGNVKLSFTRSGNKIFFTTHKPLTQGEEYLVTVYYYGTPPTTGIYGSYVYTVKDGYPTIWTITEPFGASDWFPCKNTPSDKADSSEVWITCRNDLIGVSNGLLIGETDNGDGTKTFKWKESYPIAHYLICMNIGRYKTYESVYKYSPADSMPLINYYYETSEEAGNMENITRITKQALDIYTEFFGEYAFGREKYGQIELHADWAGMENQTITCLCDFSEYLIIHEMAHQWFGNKITCASWHHIWLNEGFGTYAECIYYEQLYGTNYYHMYISDYITMGKRAKGTIYVQDATNEDMIFYSNRTYFKGAVVLHMLRKVMGDDAFFRSIKNYMADTTLVYKTAVIEDFQRAAEKEHGSSLDYFFKEWLYGENYPVYKMDWISIIEEGGYHLKINLDQKVNNNPAFFTMPVDLLIHTTGGDTTVTVFNDAQTQTFNVYVQNEPASVELDPQNWIMKGIEDIGIKDKPEIVKSFQVEQNYPNPFNPVTKINFSIPEAGRVKITVYDILGKEIAVVKDEYIQAGKHSFDFNAQGLASGTYIYKLDWNGKTVSKKMTVIK